MSIYPDLSADKLCAMTTVAEENRSNRIGTYATTTETILRLVAMIERRDAAIRVMRETLDRAHSPHVEQFCIQRARDAIAAADMMLKGDL